MFAGEIIRIAAQLSGEFLAHDGGGNGPARIDVDRDDLRHELRRAVALPADNRRVSAHLRAVLDRLDRRAGNIHRHITRAELETDFLKPRRRGRELASAPLRGDIEFAQRHAVGDACFIKTDLRLKTFHRVFQTGVPGVLRRARGARLVRQITFGGEAPPQICDGLSLRFSIKGLRKARPAAVRGNFGVAPRSLLCETPGLASVIRREAHDLRRLLDVLLRERRFALRLRRRREIVAALGAGGREGKEKQRGHRELHGSGAGMRRHGRLTLSPGKGAGAH